MARLLPLIGLLVATPAWAAGEAASPMGLVAGLVAVVAVCAGLVATRRVPGLLVSALVGAGFSAYLGYEHEHPDPDAICNVGDVLNCNVVNSSEWSEIAGVPIGFLGFGFFLAMAWLAWRQLNRPDGHAAALMVVGGVVGVGFDVFLAFQTVQLGAFCLFCATTWALNVVLLVGAALEGRGRSLAAAAKDELGLGVAVGLAAVVGAVVALGGGGGAATTGGGGPATVDLAGLYERPGGLVEVDGTEPVFGDPNARFTLLEYADYQCPHCARMAEPLHEVVVENKDVKLLFKNFPINKACNRFVETEGHGESCNAAAAGECARQQGRFWELSGLMFKNQEYLGKEDIRFLANQAGLDAAAFEACMQDPKTAEAILADVEAAGKAQIAGTPTVYLKGAFGEDWVRVRGGKDEINAVLAAAREGRPMPPPGAPTDR